MVASFDTLKAFKILQAGDIPREQADAIVDVLREVRGNSKDSDLAFIRSAMKLQFLLLSLILVCVIVGALHG